jgi:hypothetical protein
MTTDCRLCKGTGGAQSAFLSSTRLLHDYVQDKKKTDFAKGIEAQLVERKLVARQRRGRDEQARKKEPRQKERDG